MTEYLNDEQGSIAALGLAALTAALHGALGGDTTAANRLINDHINAAPSPSVGAWDVINGLLSTSASLLARLTAATGKTEDQILQELGVRYAERDPDGAA